MACNRASNIKISPVDVRWEIEERFCVDATDIVASTLDAKYFTFTDTSTNYYVWFNLDAGSTDPVPGGTGIQVNVTTGDSPATMVAAIEIAVETATTYEGVVDGDAVIFTLDSTESVLADPADVNSLMTIAVIYKGASTYLGLLDGDVETSFEETLLDINAHQTGSTILTQLRQGVSANVSLTLKECTTELYKAFITAAGEAYTPIGGTELYGWGGSKLGLNTLNNARKLNFHPVNVVSTDHTQDLTFWLAYPTPDSVTYSGENPQVMSLSFTAFLDDTKPEGISLFAFGDATQTL